MPLNILQSPSKPLRLPFAAFLTVWLAGAAAASANGKPFISTAVDFGHLIKGDQEGKEQRGLPLNRNTVKLGMVSPFGENWNLEAGFKSILWWPFGGTGNQPHERIVRVEATLEALAVAGTWGEDDDAGMNLKAGYFPYKYNPDAMNLGEYLHRSGTYPGFLLTTENWELMNGATPYFYGAHLRFTHLGGRLRHDLTLFMETEINPVGDFTPGYEFSLNSGLVEFGVGAAFNHYLSFHPSQLRPEHQLNRYVEVDSIVVGTDTLDYRGSIGELPVSYSDRTAIAANTSTKYSYRLGDLATHRGIKLMARAALDFGSLVPGDVLGPRDLRVFAEAAVLGVQNQPFYQDLSQRIPVMVGVNLPAFNMLDVLCLQMEYYGTPYNHFGNYNNLSLPQWTDNLPRSTGGRRGFHRDDYKWSLYARKSMNRIFRIHVQVANDHLRTLKFDLIKSDIPLTQTPEHWYYLVKLEMGV